MIDISKQVEDFKVVSDKVINIIKSFFPEDYFKEVTDRKYTIKTAEWHMERYFHMLEFTMDSKSCTNRPYNEIDFEFEFYTHSYKDPSLPYELNPEVNWKIIFIDKTDCPRVTSLLDKYWEGNMTVEQALERLLDNIKNRFKTTFRIRPIKDPIT